MGHGLFKREVPRGFTVICLLNHNAAEGPQEIQLVEITVAHLIDDFMIEI